MRYQYYSKQKDFYSYISKLVEEGYEIRNHYFLIYILEKGDDEVIVSNLWLWNWKNYKIEVQKYNHHFNIKMPDYTNTNLNLISGIRRNFGFDYGIDIDDQIFGQKYKNVVILLLDGLGKNVLIKNLSKKSFLRSHILKDNVSIFPSTTACATTAVISGRPPIETAWTGWHNYFKEIEKDIILFRGINYYDRKDSNNPTAYDFIPYQRFFDDMKMGRTIHPNFKKPNLKEVLAESLSTLEEDKVQYVYFTEPDNIMHGNGTYSLITKFTLYKIDKLVKKYAEKLPSDTLLLVVADHGHVPVFKTINMYENKVLFKMLKTKPSNDTRCIVFRVKEKYKSVFADTFKMFYEDIYDLYETAEAINRGFFGISDNPHPRINEFLGDFVAIAKSDYLLSSKPDFKFKSHHAGYTEEEMITPVIVFKK